MTTPQKIAFIIKHAILGGPAGVFRRIKMLHNPEIHLDDVQFLLCGENSFIAVNFFVSVKFVWL